MGGVSFTQTKAKAKRGIKVKVFIRPLTLLYFFFFFFVGLSIFISQNKVKNFGRQNFSQFFVITLTWLSVIGKKIMNL